MTPFSYARAADAAEAVRLGRAPNAKYLGGGTNLVDLMRETIELELELTRFGGHLILGEEGVHYAQVPSTLCGGISAADD